MSVTAVFDIPTMSQAQYDQVMRDLQKAGAAAPPGRLYHVMSIRPRGSQVVDVWESTQQLDAFFVTLAPILVRNGVTPPQPVITPVYNIVEGAKTALPKPPIGSDTASDGLLM